MNDTDKMTEHKNIFLKNVLKKRRVRNLFILGQLIAILAASTAVWAAKWPWQRRIGRDIEVRHKLSYQKIRPDLWPPEPERPHAVEKATFEAALGVLCGTMPKGRLEKYTASILDAAAVYDVDPFLIGALMYHQSGCRPKTPEWETRHGLTRVPIEMHAPHVRGGEYRYFLKTGETWTPHTRSLGNLRFNQWDMEKVGPNLMFAAAVLSVFEKQCKDLDAAFGGVPHRHPVSHWFFGDKVTSAEPEDAVLTVRRRLLVYYNGVHPVPVGKYNDLPLSSPLDGIPRLMLDYFGNKRGVKGTSGHQGIDLAGLSGEPVRAVADGKVSFAGVDLKGDTPSRQTTPEAAAAVPPQTLGKGGLWITLNHGKGLRTCYMHLTDLAVTQGQTVKAGDIIGTMGNSGTVSSGPHLHLEFRVDEGGRADPAVYLDKMLVNPFKEIH